MKNEKAEMKDNKEQPRPTSSCFEGASFAEMMERIMGREGIGSLCADLMRALAGGGREGTAASQANEKKERHETIDRTGGPK